MAICRRRVELCGIPLMPQYRLRRIADSERKRAIRACWECREAKRRCTLEPARNQCKRCFQGQLECVFAMSPEERASMRLQPFDEGKRTRSDTLLNSNTGSMHGSGRLVVSNPHKTHYIGEVSHDTFISNIESIIAPCEASRSLQSASIEQSPGNSIDPDQALIQKSLENFPPKSVADFLVETLFQFGEANYFYLDRGKFRQNVDHLYQNFVSASSECPQNRNPPGLPSCTNVCLVLAAFALASQFVNLQDSSNLDTISAKGPGIVFYLAAKPLLPDVIIQSSLESIQAFFLMGLFLLPTNTSDLAYVYHGMAVKMAISNGLHRRAPLGELPEIVMEVRNRLWWSLFVSDRRLGIILDRPESINEEDIDAPFPEFCQALDSNDKEYNLDNLKANIRLMLLFSDIVKLGKKGDFADDQISEKLFRYHSDLDQWAELLPFEMLPQNSSPARKTFRGNLHLQMTRDHILMYSGRASLIRIVQKKLKSAENNSDGSHSLSSCRSYVADEKLAKSCVAASYNTADLISLLSDNSRVAKFSFTDLNSCVNSAIVILIADLMWPHPKFITSISILRQAINISASTGNLNGKHSLQLLDSLVSTVEYLRNKFNHTEVPLSTSAVDTSSDRAIWEHWVSHRVTANVGATDDFSNMQSEADTLNPEDRFIEFLSSDQPWLNNWAGDNLSFFGLGL